MCTSSKPKTPKPIAPVAPGMGTAEDIRLGDQALLEDRSRLHANKYGISSLKRRQKDVRKAGKKKAPTISLKGRGKKSKSSRAKAKDRERQAQETRAQQRAQDRYDNQSGSGYTYSSPEAARRYAGRQDPTIR